MDLLINTYGTRIRSTGERIILKFPKQSAQKEYSAHRIKKIVILRPASISTHAVKLAIEHNIDIVFLGNFGKPFGRIFPSAPRGITSIRRAQLLSKDFLKRATKKYQLSQSGKRKIVEAIYQRLNQKVHWRGQNVTAQRVIELQVRALTHVFTNRVKDYHAFTFKSIIDKQ